MKKGPVTGVWLIWGLLWAGRLGAQALQITHIQEESNLSHHTVYDLTEDRWGFIWLATRYGLNRYDGYTCRLYEPQPDSARVGQWIYAVHADASGRIWTAYRDGGVMILDPGTEQFTLFAPEVPFSLNWHRVTVRKFREDSRGWLWMATNGEGVLVFDRQSKFLFRLGYDPGRTLESVFPVDFAEDSQGNVWIATSGRGIHRWVAATGQTEVFHDKRPGSPDLNSFGKALCWDPAGGLWIGTAGYGLYRFSPTDGIFTHYPLTRGGRELITGLHLDEAHRLWVTTDGQGLFMLDTARSPISNWQHDPGLAGTLSTNALYNIYEDRQGQFWIGTFNGGANLIRRDGGTIRHLQPYGPELSAGGRSILSLAPYDTQRVWIGTDGGGLGLMDLRDGATRFFTRDNSTLPGNVITALAPGEGEWVWLGTFTQGLSHFHPGTGRIQVFRSHPDDPATLSSDNVWDLSPDAGQGLWLGTMGGGVSYLPAPDAPFSRLMPSFSDTTTLSDWLAIDVLRARNGLIWIATETQGLCRYDPATKRIRRYQYRPGQQAGLRSNYLRCLFEDAAGLIWIGTEGKGLSCLDPVRHVWRHFTRADGLPSDMIDAVHQDLEGHLWVSTQQGIARISMPSGGIRSFAGAGGRVGLQYHPRAVLRLPDGTLLFGHTNGLSRVDPMQLAALTPPQVVLCGFRIFNKLIPAGQYQGRSLWQGPLNDTTTLIRISYWDNAFSFDFSGIAPAYAPGLRYAYRLMGFQPGWQYTDAANRTAAYTNLEPGRYRFEVKAAHAYGDWGAVRIIELEITPPFWKTWWFQLLIWLLVLAGVGGGVFYLLWRQQETNRQLMQAAEQKILRLENEKLAQAVSAKQERLSALLLQTAHHNEFLNGIKSEIEASSDYPTLRRRLLSAIGQELREEDYWDQFQLSFDESHQAYIRQLQRLHPGLTPSEIRLACFIRMRLSNKEIASVLNITLSGVEKGKFRLKQKLNLAREVDLNGYLTGL
ncbi:MAG: two-component regulator propeller domain-containing protein [Bacteroidia bacterium]|nr:two-component regulator propeller domain-containing protein [Bacteroidia bacterium]